MNEQEIKQLLKRYWVCETSVEEEQELLAFFSGDKHSEDLEVYRPLFTLIRRQSDIKSDKYFIAKINQSLKLHFYPMMKMAASVLILLTVGIGFYTHYQQEKQMDKIFTDTCANPEEAVKETERVIVKVSSVLQLIEEKSIWRELLDSVRNKESESSSEELIERME
jgi:hypothetical protein